MFDCLILGDSIAVGVGQAMPSCVTEAKIGINSVNYVNKEYKTGDRVADVVVISLGSNDTMNLKTEEAITLLREQIVAERVYWVLPNEKKFKAVRNYILKVAKHHNDLIIDIPQCDYSDNSVHPKDYKKIASLIK